MAFIPHSYDDGQIRPWEYLPCGAITPKVGMALTQSGGNLAIAAGTTKPTYISMVSKSAACTAGDIIPVIRVDHGIVFETTNSASFSGISRGAKVTLHASDGMQVTATTTNGVAEVIGFDAAAASGTGGRVLVRF
jgi:hypothetical protein